MNVNDRVLAFRHAGGWMVKPLCGTTFSANDRAVALRAGNSWMLAASAGQQTDTHAVAFTLANGQRALIAATCGESEPDARCQYCLGDPLPETFNVAIAGIPDICGLSVFNGTWTLSWLSDCVWQTYIASDKRVTFSMAGTWTVSWQVVTADGAGGSFAALGGTVCHPEDAIWSPLSCYAPAACTGFYAGFMVNAICAVER